MTASVVADGRPDQIHIQVWHGDHWTQEFRFSDGTNPIDLTGLLFTSQARSTLGQLNELVVSVPIPSNGTIYLQPPAAGTLEPDLYDYDIQVDDGGTVKTWIRGRIQVSQDVTP
jgi:hypothetical protein